MSRIGSANFRRAVFIVIAVLTLGILASCQTPGSIKSSGMEEANAPDEARLRARQRSLRFPAFRKWDTAKIGCSVLHLDAGFDRGDVALRRSIDYAPGDSLRAVKKKLLLVAPDLAAEALLLAAQDHLPLKPQEPSTALFCPSPGFSDLLSILHQF